MKSFLWLCLLGLSLIFSVHVDGAEQTAATEPLAGHSNHGEVFNEGPRQGAVLIEGTGAVHFPVTTSKPEAQKFFDQGVGQLHGFWYFEAERTFRQVLAIDPDCAMAYWGLAMANFGNKDRATDFIAKAGEKQENVTAREKAWIASLAKFFKNPKVDENKRRRDLVRDLEAIVYANPTDLEAKAFLLYQIYSNSKHKDGYKIPSNLVTDLLADSILEKNPRHPCNHYRIHLWDSEKPAKALNSAAQCGPSAPGIAHMWHMPGHIYSKLYRFADAAWQQEASARVDHAHQMRYGLIPDQIHNFAHNNEWLIRNLSYIGRYDDAIQLAKNMIELPRRPKFDSKGKVWQHSGTSWAYGRLRLRDLLLEYEQWDSLLALAETDYLKPGPDDIDQAEWQRLVGVASFMTNHPERGRDQLVALESALAKKEAARDKAVADAEKKNRDAKKSDAEVEKAGKSAGDNFAKAITELTNQVNELKACDLVYGSTEGLSDDKKKAVSELLPKLKNVDRARLAEMYLRLGEVETAVKKMAEEVSASKNQVVPRAQQVDILFGVGKTEQALDSFDELRKLAAYIDLDLPVMKRVEVQLKRVKASGEARLATVDIADWRPQAVVAKDIGERPSHDSLGPFRWSPQSAQEWSLTDGDGKKVSLADYRGKPLLVIFYLGRGCVHCMEQLQAFSPVHAKYAAAGIPIVAIGTDSEAGLRETYAQTNDGVKDPFPFPLLSDESLDTFRAYRTYDDFEKMALHGTFLLDGLGRIRWQDISYTPFMNADWLLEECQRLLALDDGKS